MSLRPYRSLLNRLASRFAHVIPGVPSGAGDVDERWSDGHGVEDRLRKPGSPPGWAGARANVTCYGTSQVKRRLTACPGRTASLSRPTRSACWPAVTYPQASRPVMPTRRSTWRTRTCRFATCGDTPETGSHLRRLFPAVLTVSRVSSASGGTDPEQDHADSAALGDVGAAAGGRPRPGPHRPAPGRPFRTVSGQPVLLNASSPTAARPGPVDVPLCVPCAVAGG